MMITGQQIRGHKQLLARKDLTPGAKVHQSCGASNGSNFLDNSGVGSNSGSLEDNFNYEPE